jgi:hypothetical protein
LKKEVEKKIIMNENKMINHDYERGRKAYAMCVFRWNKIEISLSLYIDRLHAKEIQSNEGQYFRGE